MGTYNAAKHAVAGWVRTLDWMPKVNGIRVNAGMKRKRSNIFYTLCDK